MVSIQYFGHSFFKIGFPKRNILIDPYVSNNQKDPAFARLVNCAAKDSDFKDIALILITHEHFDHFDKDFIEKIASRDNSCVIASESVLQELNLSKRFLHPIKMHQTINLRDVEILATPAHQREKVFFTAETLLYLTAFRNSNQMLQFYQLAALIQWIVLTQFV